MKHFKKIIIILLLVAAIITAAISGSVIFDFYYTEYKDNKVYEDLQVKYQVEPEATSNIKENETVQQLYNFDDLAKTNSDIKGWVKIPNTLIDFPVVQGTDNSKYLSYGFDNDYNINGCPFLDYRTTSSSNSLTIHGHNMGTGKEAMFSTLIQYDTQTYFSEHQFIYYASIDTPEEISQYQIFSVINFNINDLSDFDYMQRDFSDVSELNKWISEAQKRSIYKIEYTPEAEELQPKQILVLSTCDMRTYGSNGRYVIVAYKKH